MNYAQLSKCNIPATPNLQQLKLKNKSKSKKKINHHYVNQILTHTNPPTPKLTRNQLLNNKNHDHKSNHNQLRPNQSDLRSNQNELRPNNSELRTNHSELRNHNEHKSNQQRGNINDHRCNHSEQRVTNTQKMSQNDQKTKSKQQRFHQNDQNVNTNDPRGYVRNNRRGNDENGQNYDSNYRSRQQNQMRKKIERSTSRMKMSEEYNYMMCPSHPFNRAQYTLRENMNRRVCIKCASALGENCVYREWTTQQNDKKDSLHQFMQRIRVYKQVLQKHKYTIQQNIGTEQYIAKYIEYINEEYKQMMQQMQQKRKEMINMVIQYNNKHKQIYINNIKFIKEIQLSLERYGRDIQKNWGIIVQQLQYKQFYNIIQQYHWKIDYYMKQTNSMKIYALNIFIPFHEMHKIINKANIQSYPQENQLIKEMELKRQNLNKNHLGKQWFRKQFYQGKDIQ